MQVARWKVVVAGILVVLLAGAGVATYRVYTFLNTVTAGVNPLNVIQTTLGKDTNPNDVLYKIQHRQQINILLLGYSGSSNTKGGEAAPYLTDSLLVLSIDTATNRAVLTSVPRDLYVKIHAWQNGRYVWEKINAAYEIGLLGGWGNKLPQYSGKYGGGNLAMATVSRVTGLDIQYYAAVNWSAFVSVVNDLGGVNICLSTPLIDYKYPLPNGHYVPGGIHFPAGCQHVNGAQALELARSRHAVEPQQATDFARATRQRQLLLAIKSKAEDLNFLTHIPELMNQLQSDFGTNLTVADLKALWDYGSTLRRSQIEQIALTNQNFLMDQPCPSAGTYILCPVGLNFSQIQSFLANMFPPPAVLQARIPVGIYNGSQVYYFDQIWAGQLAAVGLSTKSLGSRSAEVPTTVLYNYGRWSSDAATAAYLVHMFGAKLIQEPYAPSKPALVLVLGTDAGARWQGQHQTNYYANIQGTGVFGP